MYDIQSSGMAQFGLLNNGIRVRDPSQMFTFGGTNWAHESAGLLTKNKSQQAGIFSKPLLGNQSTGSVDHSLCKKEDDIHTAITEASSSNENRPRFSLTPISQSPRPPLNYFDPFRIGQQMVKREDLHFKKPYQSPKFVNNQVSNHNHMTSHLIPVKKEDGQLWSTRPTNTWLCSPVQQNIQKFSITGYSELPSTSYAANSQIRSLSNTCFIKSKKLKLSNSEHVPSHREVTAGLSRLHDISTAELEWAQSVVRLPEKSNELADDIEMEDSLWKTNRKRRLILTTQLMQLLFQPPPANVLSEDAVTHCDVVTYYASKLVLDGASSLCSQTGKNMTSKSSSDQDLSKVIEGFIDRSKKLQDDVLRSEKKGSLFLEIMMGSRELEKFSINNRFAKFHSRRRTITGDTSSSVTRKRRPRRYVKAIPMPKMVPEGEDCLFL